MNPSFDRLRMNKRLMAYTAAAMYGGAAFDGLLEGLLPGDPRFAIEPVIGAAVIVTLLVVLGPRLSRPALFSLGPIGVVLIAYALTETPGAGDGALLYIWPVLWTTFFFGTRGAVFIVACVGVAHLGTLLLLPEASSYPCRWLDVMVSMVVVAIVVTTLVRRNDELLSQLREEARTDALTGLLNRRGFDERASLELAHARRNAQQVALATFDVDYFKRVNDEWGHEVGDRVLVHIASVLERLSRDLDVAARFGGEEFVVLLPGCTSADAETFAERVREALASNDGAELPVVHVSAGVHAELAPPNIEPLLQRADSALYNAKRAGRDRTIVFEPPDQAPPERGLHVGALG